MRTPISYYGGKQAILHHILPMIPPHKVYTECFFGGGSVFWAKNPSPNETINDRMDAAINFYRILKTRHSELHKWIDGSLISRTLHTEAKKITLGKTPCADDVKRAWAFWYACNFSFANKLGGGYKYSNDMHTSVTQTLAIKKREFTALLAARLENAYIENEDAIKVLRSRNVADAFHYLDPPYMGADQGHYKGYTETQFGDLLQFLEQECKGAFLLSNYPSPLLEEFAQRNAWQIRQVDHSSKHGPHQRHQKKLETLVWNYTAPAHRQAIMPI
jgi:DNA adenine methylase